MKASKAMGSAVPLFSAHKMALDQFVEEAMKKDQQISERKKKQRLKEAEEKKKAEEAKKPKPTGVEAIKLWGAGETDDESSSSESEDGQALITKMHEDLRKARNHGAGTSLGR